MLLASEGAFLEHSLCLSTNESQDSGSYLGSKATGQTNNCYDAMQAGATPLPGLRAGFSLTTGIAQGSQISTYEIIYIKFLQEGKV